MSILLDAADEPVTSRADYWRHVVENAIAPMALRITGGPDFQSRIHTGVAGPVQVTELTVPPATLTRSAPLVRRTDPDLCKIDVQLEGQMVVDQEGQQAPLRPGDFTLVDLSRPCRWANTPGRIAALIFPRSLLPLRRDEVARLAGLRIAADDGVAGLVSSLAYQLVAHIGDERDDGRVGTALLDLLAVTLADRLDRADAVPLESRRRTLLLRIQAFIEERLGDPELSPDMIAAAHHVSVRYLSALFEAHGETVAAWIRRRRLEQCRRELLASYSSDRPVSAIGLRWGFSNPGHFSRTFKAAFGLPPREYRSRGRDTSTAT